jgi:hypothetical protein
LFILLVDIICGRYFCQYLIQHVVNFIVVPNNGRITSDIVVLHVDTLSIIHLEFATDLNL